MRFELSPVNSTKVMDKKQQTRAEQDAQVEKAYKEMQQRKKQEGDQEKLRKEQERAKRQEAKAEKKRSLEKSRYFFLKI